MPMRKEDELSRSKACLVSGIHPHLRLGASKPRSSTFAESAAVTRLPWSSGTSFFSDALAARPDASGARSRADRTLSRQPAGRATPTARRRFDRYPQSSF